MVHPSCQSVRPDNDTLDVVSTVPGTDTASTCIVTLLNTVMCSLASKSSTVVDSPCRPSHPLKLPGAQLISESLLTKRYFLYGESKTLRK